MMQQQTSEIYRKFTPSGWFAIVQDEFILDEISQERVSIGWDFMAKTKGKLLQAMLYGMGGSIGR